LAEHLNQPVEILEGAQVLPATDDFRTNLGVLRGGLGSPKQDQRDDA
jgi:hypothetical protein